MMGEIPLIVFLYFMSFRISSLIYNSQEEIDPSLMKDCTVLEGCLGDR